MRANLKVPVITGICLMTAGIIYTHEQLGQEPGAPVQQLGQGSGAAAPLLRQASAVPAEQPSQAPAVVASAAEIAAEKLPGNPEPPLVDPVPQPIGNVPFDGNPGLPQDGSRLVKSLDRDNLVVAPVKKKHRRARSHIRAKMLSSSHHTGKANYRRHRTRAAKAYVKRHHRALAKARERQCCIVEALGLEFLVNESIENWPCFVRPAPALVRIPKR